MSDTKTGDWIFEPNGPLEQPVVHGRIRRRLVEGDVKRMNLGKAYWYVEADKIQDKEVREIVVRFKKKIVDHINSGHGLVIGGAEGVGKSGAAAIIAQEAARWGYTVRIVSHEELQTLRFEDRPFDDASSIMTRVRSVDLLVLDDFNEDFVDDGKFGPKQLEKLVAYRNKNRRSTILTTRIASKTFGEDPRLKTLSGILKENAIGMTIEGQDLRKILNAEIRKSIMEEET